MLNRHIEGKALRLLGVAAALPLFASSALADSAPTQIFENVVVGRGSLCTIEILDGPIITVCAGGVGVAEAMLDCADGFQQTVDPQWFIDGNPIGTGDVINFSVPTAGTYILEVNCGSCSDQVTIDAIDCLTLPRLDAAFADDAVEATTGVFQFPNEAPISPVTFGQLRYNMRPVSLDKDPGLTEGSFTLTLSGDAVIDLHDPDTGAPIALPATYDWSELPVEFLANATDHGAALLTATYNAPLAGAPVADAIQFRVGPWPGLSGEATTGYPYMNWVDSFFDEGDVMRSGLDPVRHIERVGLDYDVYVVDHKTAAQWSVNNTLTDVTGTVESGTVAAGSLADNIIVAWAVGLDAGSLVSKHYDIVYDFGQDGTLDPGDLIDGLVLDATAGAYVIKDLTEDGPYNVVETTYSFGTWRGQNLYYPSNIGSLGEVPLMVVSHGNGHQYTWYDYLGNHMASHGYVLMSHQNQTGPGIETASITTLENTEEFLANLGTIAGGILDGHIDRDKILWVGHSRGAEGVARAYDKIVDEGYPLDEYDENDIAWISSIAPTVFLAATASDPHDANYHVIGAAGDGDVSGAPNCTVCQYNRLTDRAERITSNDYIHGSMHNDFNCCGFNDYTGPADANLTRPEAQDIAQALYLANAEWYGKGNAATKEYLTRLFDDFRAPGIVSDAIVARHWVERGISDHFVIDDFQTMTADDMSSSGGMVTNDFGADPTYVYEEQALNGNNDFSWTTSDPMNGMTFHSGSGDFSNGAVWGHTLGSDRFIEFEIIPGERDVRDMAVVSFRACQGTRHPDTVALDDYHNFTVTLRDGAGTSSSINFGEWGNLTPLFQRTGSGSGRGWTNEMNTVRIPLTAFETDGSGLDLSDIVAVRLEFGASYGSERGRIGFDDLQFMAE